MSAPAGDASAGSGTGGTGVLLVGASSSLQSVQPSLHGATFDRCVQDLARATHANVERLHGLQRELEHMAAALPLDRRAYLRTEHESDSSAAVSRHASNAAHVADLKKLCDMAAATQAQERAHNHAEALRRAAERDALNEIELQRLRAEAAMLAEHEFRRQYTQLQQHQQHVQRQQQQQYIMQHQQPQYEQSGLYGGGGGGGGGSFVQY